MASVYPEAQKAGDPFWLFGFIFLPALLLTTIAAVYRDNKQLDMQSAVESDALLEAAFQRVGTADESQVTAMIRYVKA